MYEFTLENHKGQRIEYMVTPHDPLDGGIDLVLNLMSLAIKPLGRMLDSNLVELVKTFRDGGLENFLGQDLAVLSTFKLGAADFGDDFATFLARVSGPKLIQAVLKETYRDGKHLKDPAVFNKAYSQNYGEMLAAFQEVVKYNGFLGLLSTFASTLQMKGLQTLAPQSHSLSNVAGAQT